MKKEATAPIVINSISELHRLLNLPGPLHPLVTVIDLANLRESCPDIKGNLVYNFYSVCIKKDFKGLMKYGQNFYDFDKGIMSFFSPAQVISTNSMEEPSLNGLWLSVHADFVRNYSLGKQIKNYGFFSYAVNEALHLSEKEEAMITTVMKNIEMEYQSATDQFSQDVMIAQIELLLTYCNRFYNRQFITRKQGGNDLLIRLDDLLNSSFDDQFKEGLPTVQSVAEQLNVSPGYLSDMLRTLTGHSAQQHIHDKLIEKAKEALTTTNLSVSEIAYKLGFGYPQSFSKLFKSKTNLSPLEFRHAFN
jgi:AraC-like DNA-binding protein